MVSEGYSYRQIARELHLSKTTVNEIVKRHNKYDINTGCDTKKPYLVSFSALE